MRRFSRPSRTISASSTRCDVRRKCGLRTKVLTSLTQVFTLHEEESCPVEGVVNIKFGKRATFKSVFDVANANSNAGDLLVIANSDIYFDETLEALGVPEKDLCVTLTRYEPDGTLYTDDLKGSQDSWIFQSPIATPEKSDFYFGVRS
jgi:hypothetical protein